MTKVKSSMFLLLLPHLLIITIGCLCFTAHVGLPKCCVDLTSCQDWCSSPDLMSSLSLSPPGQLFLRPGESKLVSGRAPAINPTTQIPCDTGGSLSDAMRDLLMAWQTPVIMAPALRLSCSPAVLEYVSAALLDRWERHVQMGLSLWQQIHGVSPEKCCS